MDANFRLEPDMLRAVERAEHVGLEAEVRVHAELFHGVGDRRDVDVSHEGRPPICAAAAFARSAICAGGTSSLWVAIDHSLPNGSRSLPKRSPQNMSVGGIRLVQPASTAFRNAASTSVT